MGEWVNEWWDGSLGDPRDGPQNDPLHDRFLTFVDWI